MAIKVITDSSCDLPDEVLKKFDIDMVPLKVSFENGDTFLDRYELSPAAFVTKMRSYNTLPKTTSPDPGIMMEAFEKGLSTAGQVLFISLSSALSGAYQTANVAKDMLATDQIKTFDSLSASLGSGIMAIKAVQMANQGLNLDEILERLSFIRTKSVVLFTLDSLDNLVKGGRLKRHEGISGNLLKIKPIMRVNNQGVVEVIEKVRGRKKAINRLLQIMGEYGGDTLSDKIIGISHVDCLAEAQSFAQAMKDHYQLKQEIIISEMGATIGTYVGEGGISVIF